MIEFIYLCHCKGQDGKPLTRRTAIVTTSPNLACRLLTYWNNQGVATGHRYEPVGFFVHVDDVTGLDWQQSPVGNYATLNTAIVPASA